MGSYILRRMLIMLPSVLGISVVLFTVLALAPGDPFEELATNPAVPAEVRQMLRAKFGLDDPVWQRYFRWLAAMLQGDWGYSFVSRIDVDTLILQRVPVTLAIIGASQVLALMVALPVGIYSAMRPYSLFDRIASTFAFVGFSLPTFFTGILFILIFSITLDWLPFVYRADLSATGWQWWWEQFKQSIMPVTVLGLFQGASWTRYVRSAVLDVIRLDYVTTARSKGLPERVVVMKHVVRNASDSGGHAGGADDAGGLRRSHRHRADLPYSRHRLAVDRRDPAQRHAGHHVRDVRPRLPRDPVQLPRRPDLWLARPSHQLPLTFRLCAECVRSRCGARRGDASAAIAWRW